MRLMVLGVAWKWGRKGCIRDEIGAERQLQYICLVLTHVAFDFQCEVQKSFIMTQLLRDVCAVCVCFLFVEGGVEGRWVAKGVS